MKIMELSHSLVLNEEALKEIPEPKRPVFVFEWLRFLDKVLSTAQKADIKGYQKKLVAQLLDIIQESPGPPTRRLVARCLATLFSVGDTFLLFDTVNKCNDILKNKDDSPSFPQTKLAAICCIGFMYQKLGRMMGRSYEETVQILIKCLRNAESLTRIEVMLAFEKVCCGMGAAISNIHKEIYKAARHCLTDRVMAVRCAASKCLLEMSKHAPFIYTTELESMAALCFRAFDGANYEARYAIAKLLGTLVASTQTQANNQLPVSGPKKDTKEVSLDDAFGILMSGFLRGGTGFLKGTGEIIKGSSTVNREVRVGVTHAYVIFIQILGANWLERNTNFILNHILDLVANPKAASSHIDAVYSRKCINFILRSILGRMLSEKAQASTCKQLAIIVAKQMATIDFSPENAKDSNQETLFGQHLLVCALQEMGLLMLSLGTTANNLISDPSCGLIEAVMAVLIHPCYAARLAAAWCLRCICIAVPGQCTILINRCLEGLENMKTTSEAISGYSGALAAVLGGVRLSPLGVPHTKGKIIFNTAEELLRSANQNSRLSLHRTQAGWLLIGSIMTLGSSVVRSLLPRMVLLWRNSFPRSNKELDSEKARGDAFTWQVTLEGRGGALSSMHSFLQNCPELVNEDIIRRLLTPIESAISMLINMGSVIKSYGQHIKAPAATVRHRLYETLSLIPPHAFEGSYTHILRLLVSEFTLSENPANTTCSLLRASCHTDESVLLGTAPLLHTDHRIVEDQLMASSASGSGALEHDPCCLYRPMTNEELPGPLPLGVAVIDSSVSLFGLIFPRVANKHRFQILEHFVECIKQAKSSRADAVTINIFASLLAALKGLTEAKGNIGQEDVRKAATSFIVGTLTNSSPILRCAAAESLGRLAQVVADPRFTAELAQTSFDRLRNARDVASRTGHSLALGCIHRYVGGMGSSQHLNMSVSILLALAQDCTSPVVQVWSLYALSLIAESGGPMFRGYVEPSLSLALKLLLTVPQSHVDVHHCIGKVLSALITVIGPELQGNATATCTARSSFLCACAIMQDHQDPLVQTEATACLQQLHLFTPRHVNLSSFVPTLCKTLPSNHLLLRKAAVSCLRQLAQREAREICEHALTLINENNENATDDYLAMTESGLPGLLFKLLDTETDKQLIKDVHDTLTSMLQMLAADNLTQWLSLCRSVLTITSESNTDNDTARNATLVEETEEEGDDLAEFKTGENNPKKNSIQPRWPTRVFAAECVRRIITTCQAAGPAHFDLQLAKELNLSKNKGDYLVSHLSELIRMAFIAATSDSDELRLEGLRTLHIIIDKFSKVPEPEFPGHLLLEQFQAQVGAALRPAFSNETASHVTAAACAVCSAWIGSGVAKDLNDLRRVHQLLVSSLTKLQNTSNATTLYNESVATLEKLSILKAWAEVYIVAMVNEGYTSDIKITMPTIEDEESDEDFGKFESKGESLLSLVQPELSSLAEHWLAALRDHALLMLPPEYSSQLPRDGGAFYTNDTMDSCRPHYCATWPALLHAATLWLTSDFFKQPPAEKNDKIAKKATEYFGLIFGICMESLCNSRSVCPTDSVITCLRTLYALLSLPYPRQLLTANSKLPIEVCNVLHRLILTKDHSEIHRLCMDVLKQTILAVQESLTSAKKSKFKELYPVNQDVAISSVEELDLLGEGGEDGNINHTQGFVFAVLEVCLCLIVRQMPTLNWLSLVSSTVQTRQQLPSNELSDLVASSITAMESLPDLCSPAGAVSILPTVLYLTTSVMKEIASMTTNGKTNNVAVTTALHALRSFVTHKYCADPRSSQQWKSLLQSTMAKMIDLAKTGSDEKKIDEVCIMLALSVFVLNAPADVIVVPNLQYPCINYFRHCFQSENIQVRMKCVQTLKHLFNHSDKTVSNGYILALAPRLVEYLHLEPTKCPNSELELQLSIEVINAVESLIRLAEPDKGVKVLGMLVPALVGFLLEESMKFPNKYQKSLHEHSLQWLTKIGPQYPQEFKTVISQNGNLRSKLEAAARAKGQKGKLDQKTVISKNAMISTAPTIKLKTDFTNFQSSIPKN
ncbi:HEAT repeat-containing protein 5B isoform X2 [Planococcus citri]|uniref:HEAT repeat-containing protein 5B isoform X2 n=1 Tax=Planococcus citri TaxID=170843 RepID=UPI0031F97E72